MKTAIKKTLSTVPITVPDNTTRTTLQTLRILNFIHRFRHVTARHIQINLQHATKKPTHKQLSLLRAKGLIARQYSPEDRAANRAASYFLTPEGLSLLKTRDGRTKYRAARSVKADAAMGIRQRERYHTLADVYVYFKQHNDGQFELFTSFDVANLDCVPQEVPDGYVRLSLPGIGIRHYFIEIYGWNRSSQAQRRRIHSYMQFAESTQADESMPGVFVVAGSKAAQARLKTHFKEALTHVLSDSFHVYTTIASRLDSTDSSIWSEVTV
jgi:DNA-binding MarR family transcriptional regulator